MCWLVETYFEKGVISEKICKMIYTWNSERGCEKQPKRVDVDKWYST